MMLLSAICRCILMRNIQYFVYCRRVVTTGECTYRYHILLHNNDCVISIVPSIVIPPLTCYQLKKHFLIASHIFIYQLTHLNVFTLKMRQLQLEQDQLHDRLHRIETQGPGLALGTTGDSTLDTHQRLLEYERENARRDLDVRDLLIEPIINLYQTKL